MRAGRQPEVVEPLEREALLLFVREFAHHCAKTLGRFVSLTKQEYVAVVPNSFRQGQRNRIELSKSNDADSRRNDSIEDDVNDMTKRMARGCEVLATVRVQPSIGNVVDETSKQIAGNFARLGLPGGDQRVQPTKVRMPRASRPVRESVLRLPSDAVEVSPMARLSFVCGAS